MAVTIDGSRRKNEAASAALRLHVSAVYGNPRRVAACELCVLTRTTQWYAEFTEPFAFVIIDCDSCDVPMAVLGMHRAATLPDEREVMRQALQQIADSKFPHGWFFDDHMRQIPDHYHLHARPYPSWWPKERRQP